MDKEMKVFKKLKKQNREYSNRLDTLITVYEDELNEGSLVRTVGYTPHSVEKHCTNIYRILSDIIPDEFYSKYVHGENLFLLLCAVLFHDIQMARDSRPEYRCQHSELAKEIILKEIYSEETTVLKTNIPRDMAEALGDIIYAHSDIKSVNGVVSTYTFEDTVKKYNTNGLDMGKNEELNVPYLAAMLRLADELDLDYNRISGIGYENKYNTEESKKHFTICEYFKKVKVNERELVLKIDEIVFGKLQGDDIYSISAQIISTYEKVRREFEQMKHSVLFNTKYAPGIWKIENIRLENEELYRENSIKKKI